MATRPQQKAVIREGNNKSSHVHASTHTHTQLAHPLRTKKAGPRRTEEEEEGSGWSNNTVMLRRILTGCGGSLKGVC